MNRRRILIALGALAGIAAGWFVYGLYSTRRGIPDAYAAWDAGTLIVEYLATHDGQWPRSWQELEKAEETLPNRDRHLYSYVTKDTSEYDFDNLRRRVTIDWNADPNEIAKATPVDGELPVRVVTRPDGSDFPVLFVGTDPNRIVWVYLRRRASNAER